MIVCWKDGRVVECTGLENRRLLIAGLGFKSLSFHHIKEITHCLQWVFSYLAFKNQSLLGRFFLIKLRLNSVSFALLSHLSSMQAQSLKRLNVFRALRSRGSNEQVEVPLLFKP